MNSYSTAVVAFVLGVMLTMLTAPLSSLRVPVLDISNDDDVKKSAFRLPKGRSTDVPGGSFPMLTLAEVISKLRLSGLASFCNKPATIINVGASYKDVDPIYHLDMAQVFPQGNTIYGYECNPDYAKILSEKRPDVKIRQLCVNGTNIVTDLEAIHIPKQVAILKTDIDSIDGVILDSVLRVTRPDIVYSEITWDFPPPIDFAGLSGYGVLEGGCFGFSINMASRILKRHGYVLIEAAHANIMAVREEVAERLFSDRPHSPWFWYQATKSPLLHTHWRAKRSPYTLLPKGLGLFNEVQNTDGHDNFGKPLVLIRDVDTTMRSVAKMVEEQCGGTGMTYMLAVDDRCCAPQWGDLKACRCEFDLQDN